MRHRPLRLATQINNLAPGLQNTFCRVIAPAAVVKTLAGFFI